jgi:hypothetical protein
MTSDDKKGSSAARGAWVASGLTFFLVGVVFTLTMPDNVALGITFLGLGVVFFSLSATQRAPGDGPGGASGGDGGNAGDADVADASRDGDDSAAASPEDPPQR